MLEKQQLHSKQSPDLLLCCPVHQVCGVVFDDHHLLSSCGTSQTHKASRAIQSQRLEDLKCCFQGPAWLQHRMHESQTLDRSPRTARTDPVHHMRFTGCLRTLRREQAWDRLVAHSHEPDRVPTLSILQLDFCSHNWSHTDLQLQCKQISGLRNGENQLPALLHKTGMIS